jgi:hypothetical protein
LVNKIQDRVGLETGPDFRDQERGIGLYPALSTLATSWCGEMYLSMVFRKTMAGPWICGPCHVALVLPRPYLIFRTYLCIR